MSDMEHFGQQLRSARRQKGFTQAQLADGLCDRSMVSRIESGATRPPIDLIQQFAERLSMPQLIRGLISANGPGPNLGLAPLYALMRQGQYDEAFRVGQALFWTLSDFGEFKAMRKVVDILATIPVAPGRDRVSLLSALLYQQIARHHLSEAFDVGLELVRAAADAAQYDVIVTIGQGLLSLQPHESLKAPLLIAVGTGYRRLGQTAQAFQIYTMGQAVADAAQIRREQARALHGLSACFLEDKDYAEAIHAAEQASAGYQQGEPLYWLAQQNLGIAYLQTNRTAEGMDILERCGVFWESQHDMDAKRSVLEEMAGQ